MKNLSPWNIIGIVIISCILFFGLILRCTYRAQCTNCHFTFLYDIYVPTDPNICPYKICPYCGDSLQLEIHNNLNLITGREKWNYD